jgi:hypothetical protein
MRPLRPCLVRGVLFGATLLCASCSGSGLNVVQGKVLYKGEPAKGAVVIFHPKGDDSITAVRPSGVTGEDGTFTLGSGKNSGAPAGDYVVTVTWPEERQGTGKITMEPPPPPPDRLKGRYADRAKSSFNVTIKSGTNQLEPFELR